MRERIAKHAKPKPTNGKAHPAIKAAPRKAGRPAVQPPTPPPKEPHHDSTQKAHNAGLLIS
jgi:hypothetical protein